MDELESAPKHLPPVIVEPKSGRHKQSLVILHGRGSNGYMFGSCLLEHEIPAFHDLQNALPHAKFIFPTAARRRAQIWNRSIINQWFDNWTLQSPEEKEELQLEGLCESSAYVHDLLRSEIEVVGASNVILWGLSQGCATALISMLLWQGPKIAAVIGMCGWCPLRRRMHDLLSMEQIDDEDPFWTTDSKTETCSPRQVVFSYLHEELGQSTEQQRRPLEMPVFLGHGSLDAKVPVHLAHEARDFLHALGMDVQYKEYADLGHWYSGPMLSDILLFIRQQTDWMN